MAFSPTPAQKAMLRKGSFTGIGAGKTFRLWGTLGTLDYFGFSIDENPTDLEGAGISRSVTRAAGKRSRWLGDSVKQSVAAHTANVAFYPSRRGTALPGSPIVFEDLTNKERWTLNLEGDIGSLVAYLTNNRPPVDVQLYGKTGNRYVAPILHIDPNG